MIDADGMLTVSLADIIEGFDPADAVEEDEVLAVLRRVQQFDPPGVAARDLSECLALQLKNLPEDTEHRDAAITLVCCHLELLAAKDFTALARKTKLDEPTLAQVVTLIQSLNPRPGSVIATGTSDYVIPGRDRTQTERPLARGAERGGLANASASTTATRASCAKPTTQATPLI